MANSQLCKYYLEQGNANIVLPRSSSDEILEVLDRYFHNNWTWEISDEKLFADGLNVSTTVTVYFPGRVLTGRSFCKIQDYPKNHLKAIHEACQCITDKRVNTEDKKVDTVKTKEQNTINQKQDSINDILAHSSNIQMADTSSLIDSMGMVEVANDCPLYDSAAGETPETIPPTIKIPAEMAEEINKNSTPTSISNQSENPGYEEPQEKYKGFSQKQMDDINQFKVDFDVSNDEMFINYIKTWSNNQKTKKSDLTPQNIDSFIKWVKELGKMAC